MKPKYLTHGMVQTAMKGIPLSAVNIMVQVSNILVASNHIFTELEMDYVVAPSSWHYLTKFLHIKSFTPTSLSSNYINIHRNNNKVDAFMVHFPIDKQREFYSNVDITIGDREYLLERDEEHTECIEECMLRMGCMYSKYTTDGNGTCFYGMTTYTNYPLLLNVTPSSENNSFTLKTQGDSCEYLF